MLIRHVKLLEPVDRWLYWIRERERIRIRKEVAKEAPPWTDDEILQKYRFCNIKRQDDRVSRWLMEYWYEPHKDHKNILPAAALARFINNPDSLKEVTQVVFGEQWKPKSIGDALREYKNQGHTVFSPAYMVRGMEGVDKIDSVLNHHIQPLVGLKYSTESMAGAWSTLMPCYGMGSFMAGQIVADLRWAQTGEWVDRQWWAPAGPGSIRGMNRLGGNPLKTPISQDKFEYNLCKLIKLGLNQDRSRADHIPDLSHMEGIDWQNTLCEFDKYERALWGEGRPKRLYTGVSTSDP